MNFDQLLSGLRPFDVFILILILLNSLFLFRRFKGTPVDHAKISVYPMGVIKIVVANDQIMRLNVSAQFFNWGHAAAKLGHLEIRLRGPRDRNHTGQWKLFYQLGTDGNFAPREAGKQSIQIPGQEMKTFMLQFEETPALARRFSIWTEGQYELHFAGWSDGKNVKGQPDFQSDRRHFSISPELLKNIAVHMTEKEEPQLVAIPFDEFLFLLS